jgi:Protein of unknown function (DUF3995)
MLSQHAMVGHDAAFLLVVAAWALYVAAVHVRGGTPRVISPLRGADLPDFARATLVVVWHATTLTLLVLAGSVVAAALSSHARPLLAFGLVQACGFGLIFWRVARREIGEPIRLPQWLLFGPLALALASSFTSHPAAVAASAMLVTLGLAHVAWAAGSAWPARDGAQLASYVVPEGFAARGGGRALPSRAATASVAVSLFGMAVAALAPAFDARARGGALAVSALFALRGVFGLLYTPWSPRASRQPFAVYNRVLFSPACLFVAAIIALDAV